MDPVFGAAALFWIFFMIFFLVIIFGVLASTFFWIWMLVDAIVTDFKDSTEKVIWILVLLLTGLLGALIYFIVVKTKKNKTEKKKK